MTDTKGNILIIGNDITLIRKSTMKFRKYYNIYIISSYANVNKYNFEAQHIDIIALYVKSEAKESVLTLDVLKRNIHSANIPVIILANSRDKHLIVQEICRGAENYLLTSSSDEEVRSLIDSYINKKEILIADDDIMLLETMKLFLEPKYRVTAVASGQQILNYMIYHKPDLIILDNEMPYMDGIVTLNLLNSKDNCKNIPVILMTGTNDKNVIIELMSNGAADYIIKPIQKDSLLNIVDRVILP